MSESIHIDDIRPSEPRQELTGDQIKRATVIYSVGHISCPTLEERLVDFIRPNTLKEKSRFGNGLLHNLLPMIMVIIR